MRQLNQKIYAGWMKEAGWEVHRMDGELLFFIDLEDRRLISFAYFSQATDFFLYEDGGSIGFHWHNRVAGIIRPGMKNEFGWLVQRKNTEYRKFGEGNAGFIIECTDDLIRWAKSINTEEDVNKQASTMHNLAVFAQVEALAITGEERQLQDYLDQRKEDPNLDPFDPQKLHPMIKVENLAAAVEVAKFFQAHPMNWQAPDKSVADLLSQLPKPNYG